MLSHPPRIAAATPESFTCFTSGTNEARSLSFPSPGPNLACSRWRHWSKHACTVTARASTPAVLGCCGTDTTCATRDPCFFSGTVLRVFCKNHRTRCGWNQQELTRADTQWIGTARHHSAADAHVLARGAPQGTDPSQQRRI